MLLEEQGVRGSVVATDLSTVALGRTVAGTYSSREIAGLSPARRDRFLVARGNAWQVTDEIRSRVRTSRHNLVAPLPDHVAACQVVFCRNVLIYFSPSHARAFLGRLADSLPPGAFLFLGGAESLWQVSDRFRAVRIGSSFVYQRCVASSDSTPEAAVRARPRSASPIGASVRRAVLDARAARRRPAEDIDAGAQAGLAADAGRDALADGDHAAAVIAFRKWCYLAPDDPVAALHLGLAFEAGGHEVPARRAFGVSRAVLDRIGPGSAEGALGGYAPEELARLLDIKQGMGG